MLISSTGVKKLTKFKNFVSLTLQYIIQYYVIPKKCPKAPHVPQLPHLTLGHYSPLRATHTWLLIIQRPLTILNTKVNAPSSSKRSPLIWPV
jgi:hypothetical protein